MYINKLYKYIKYSKKKKIFIADNNDMYGNDVKLNHVS